MKRLTNKALLSFLSAKKIDTYQKLRLLLFLHNHPHQAGTSQDFAQWLHLGDTLLLESIVSDLEAVSLVTQVENRYVLSSNPDIQQHLQDLAIAYENPITRQEILKQINAKRPSTNAPFAFV